MGNFGELRTSTIREFDGGWNTVTSDLNLPTKYSKIETYVYYGLTGNKQVRYGTSLFTDVKGYDVITETHLTVNVEPVYTLTIAQDTIHTIKDGDSITITAPSALAGTYEVVGNYYSMFTIISSASNLQTSYGEVTYHIGTDSVNSVLTCAATVNGNTITMQKYKNPTVAKGKKINITAPLELMGEYEVKTANTNNFTIKIAIEATEPQLAAIKYTYDTDTVVNKYSTTNTLDTKICALFDYLIHNNLLQGHTLEVLEPLSMAGTYTVLERTDTDYIIDITNKGITTTQTNVKIKYDNSNITGSRIINGTYFVDKLICVSDIGEVIAVDGEGDGIIIFNDTIANTTNTGNPGGWSNTSDVCFSVFNGILTIWNGINKPLFVDLTADVPCNYLVDEATQSNAMIPIAKYAIAINHYLVAGNVFDEQSGQWKSDRIMISDYDTIGTFNDGTADTLDNGGISVDIGKICSSATSEIRGLSRYRSQLIVSFDEVSVLGTLGITIDTTTADGIEYKLHKPDFADVISDYGCISNKSFQNILGDTCCLSFAGVGAFKKQAISALTIANRLSTIIGPELYQAFDGLSSEALTERIWSVFNAKEQQYLLFIPNKSTLAETTETLCFAYTIPSTGANRSDNGAWSLFKGWNFQWGCTSALKEVFFGDTTKIYLLGNTDRPFYADFQNDPLYPADEDTGIDGKAIAFDWEFGWQYFGDKTANKHSRYLAVSTNGSGQFSVGAWFDYVKDTNTCEMSIDFAGGDSDGWGAGRQRYGGGRRTNTEKLFAFTARFHLIKLKISGTSKEKLQFNSISIYYQTGNIRR